MEFTCKAARATLKFSVLHLAESQFESDSAVNGFVFDNATADVAWLFEDDLDVKQMVGNCIFQNEVFPLLGLRMATWAMYDSGPNQEYEAYATHKYFPAVVCAAAYANEVLTANDGNPDEYYDSIQESSPE